MRLLGARPHWTPAELPNVFAWWDASHTASFTFSSGSVVSAWASRVGSYSLGQSTSGKRPSRSGTVNGLPSVVFDGTDDALSVASFNMSGGNKYSLWTVVSASSGSDRIVAELGSDFNSGAGRWILYRQSDNKVASAYFHFAAGGAGGYSAFTTTGTVTTTPKAVVSTYDGSLSTDEMSAWLNGSSSGSRPNNGNGTANLVSDTLYVGARGGTSIYLNGQICELGVCTTAIGSTDRAKLGTYLSAKWGLGF